MQPLQFRAARGTLLQMLSGGHVARLQPWLPQREQRVDRQMIHASTSSPSQRRSLVCARASWDFEKLTVFPIMSAISSCV